MSFLRQLAVAAALLVPLLVPGAAEAADGPTWGIVGAVAHHSETAVACSTARTCWAVEGDRLISTYDGGADWTDRTADVPAEVADLADVACARRGPCYAAAATRPDGSEVLVLDGSSVSVSALPGSAGSLAAISCPGPQRCVTIDEQSSYTTVDGGASWTTQRFAGFEPGYPSVACSPGTRSCWTGNSQLLHSTDLGATWSPAPSPSFAVDAIDCPDTQTCVFTGVHGDQYQPTAMRTTDDGAHFTLSRLPSRGTWDGLSCGSATSCQTVNLGGQTNNVIVVAQTTDGTTWTAVDHPDVPPAFGDAVFCVSASRCLVLGNGTSLITTDAGATWQIVGLPYGFGDEPPSIKEGIPGNVLTVLDCPSNAQCLAIGTDVFERPRAAVSANGGRTWSEYPFPASAGVITDAQCTSSTNCVAIGGSGGAADSETLQAFRSSDGGRSWQPGTISGPGELGDLDCRGAMFCVAIGGNADKPTHPVVRVTRDGGATWSSAPLPKNSGPLSSVACTADSCALFSVGQFRGSRFISSRAWTSDAQVSVWTARPLPRTPYGKYVADVDCTADACLAVGEHGVSDFHDEDDLVLISCDGGKTWTTHADLLGSVAHPTRASCGTADRCALTIRDTEFGQPETFTTTDGGLSWTRDELPSYIPYYQPSDITCTATRCLAPATGRLDDLLVVARRFSST